MRYSFNIDTVKLSSLLTEVIQADRLANREILVWGTTADSYTLHHIFRIVSITDARLIKADGIARTLATNPRANGNPNYVRNVLRFILAIVELKSYLNQVTGAEYTSYICCRLGKNIAVRGLYWWLGYDQDSGYIPYEATKTFVDGGSFDEFKAALKNSIL